MNIDLAVLASPLVILALVNLGKKFGASGRWSMLLAVILGIVLAVLDGTLAGNVIYGYASNGLLIGLSAAGLYDVAAIVGTRKEVEPVEMEPVDYPAEPLDI